MTNRIKRELLDKLAAAVGMEIQKDCGGFRVVKDQFNVFPNHGVCPTATKRECVAFLLGVKEGTKQNGKTNIPGGGT